MAKTKKTKKYHKQILQQNIQQKPNSKKSKSQISLEIKNSLLDTIKLGRELGKGMYGTVYLASDKNGNEYAYKIEKIFPKDVEFSYSSNYWREIDFAENLANKYPDHFMVLYDSKIEPSCEHKQDFSSMGFSMKDLSKERIEYYEKLAASPYCGIKLWSIVDGIFHYILDPKPLFPKNVIYDNFIQIVYIVYLMNNAGYIHNDLHWENIGFTLTNKKNIKILDSSIPTHGRLIKAIDYGKIQHRKYLISKDFFENNSDLLRILQNFCLEVGTVKINGHNWHWKQEWIKPYQKLKITKSEEKELEQYLPEDKILIKENKKYLINKLFKLLEWKKWQRRIMKDKTITCVAPNYLIPLDTILFLIKNIYNPKKVLEYLIKHRQNI